MKKHIKLFLSLILAFTLIPILHINTASATDTLNLGEVTVPPTHSVSTSTAVNVATCLINDASYTFTAIPTGGNVMSGLSCQTINNSIGCKNNGIKDTVSKLTEVIFGVINLSGDTETVDTTLQLDLGANGCYNCTLLNGTHVSGCGSGSGNNDNDNTNKDTSGVSRILTPLATILGGLLLLF